MANSETVGSASIAAHSGTTAGDNDYGGHHEIVAFLRGLGATDAQIERARRECRLAGLAADVVLAEGASLSATDLAGRIGVPVDRVVGVWRLLGVAVPDASQLLFSERDVAFTSQAVAFGMAPQAELLRVLGSSLATVAEAAVSFYVQTVEPRLNVPDVDEVVFAKDLADTASLALQLGDSMGTVFAHHLRDAISRQRAAQAGLRDEPALSRLAVGFVDLVGFTPISRHASPSDLLDLIGEFEVRAFEVAGAHGGRIVKHIGDEVMFVALDVVAGCTIARSLTSAFDTAAIEPRAGLAFGEVISRYGDYYGPVVNLAARLADLAVPKEVLVDAATAAAAGAGSVSLRPAGRRLLKGFDEPVEVYSLDP